MTETRCQYCGERLHHSASGTYWVDSSESVTCWKAPPAQLYRHAPAEEA